MRLEKKSMQYEVQKEWKTHSALVKFLKLEGMQ